jgi:hypothetical protein
MAATVQTAQAAAALPVQALVVLVVLMLFGRILAVLLTAPVLVVAVEKHNPLTALQVAPVVAVVAH